MRTLNALIIAVLLVTVMACGKATVEPEFQSYLADFQADAKRFNRDVDTSQVSIKFGDTGSMENGAVCHTGSKQINVQKSAWANGNDTDRMIIIYHELGHCVLGLNHTTELGIMSSNAVPEVVYRLNPDLFLTSFFEVK